MANIPSESADGGVCAVRIDSRVCITTEAKNKYSSQVFDNFSPIVVLAVEAQHLVECNRIACCNSTELLITIATKANAKKVESSRGEQMLSCMRKY